MSLLDWLIAADGSLKAYAAVASTARLWPDAVALANQNLSPSQTNHLDQSLLSRLGDASPADLATKPVRLAILGSCTVAQLQPAIRIGGVRRNIHVTVYEAEYGQYWQELSDAASALHGFRPNVILLALDAHTISRPECMRE